MLASYESLRRRHFPVGRNLIPAHLTLFHQLDDDPYTRRTVNDVADATSDFILSQPVARSIGRGVAIFFQSEAATTLHTILGAAFQAHLIPQDRQRFQPHIVIQNKVDPETARNTLSELRDSPLPEPCATGLILWRYLGGPWERLDDFPFALARSPLTKW